MDPCVREITELDDLFDCLRFSQDIWKDATFQELAFRGQGDATLALTPKAFRNNQRLGYGLRAIDAPSDSIAVQAKAEYEAVRAFVEWADRVGLELPGDIGAFREHRNKQGQQAQRFWQSEWPQYSDLELLAIAQHHHIPTRLLDFTYMPTVAAYFAASDCWDRVQRKENPSAFTVWAVDLRFFKLIRNLSSEKSSERIREVVVPRHSNSLLRAQQGLFLVDDRASIHWDGGKHTSMQEVLDERTEHWISQKKGVWEGQGIDPAQKFVLPFARLDIDAKLALDTLKRLHREGINEATIYPTHDRIHQALEVYGQPSV